MASAAEGGDGDGYCDGDCNCDCNCDCDCDSGEETFLHIPMWTTDDPRTHLEILHASHVRNHFSDVILEVQRFGPRAIARHGKVLAVLYPAGGRRDQNIEGRMVWLDRERCEDLCLIQHMEMAIRLLTMSDVDARIAVRAARAQVLQWRPDLRFPQEHADRWLALLEMPHRRLALAMVEDHTGAEARALRRKSPWELL